MTVLRRAGSLVPPAPRCRAVCVAVPDKRFCNRARSTGKKSTNNYSQGIGQCARDYTTTCFLFLARQAPIKNKKKTEYKKPSLRAI